MIKPTFEGAVGAGAAADVSAEGAAADDEGGAAAAVSDGGGAAGGADESAGGAEEEVLSSAFLPNEPNVLVDAGAAPPRGAPNVVGAVLGASAALSSGLPKRGFAPPPPPKRPPVDWPGGGPAGVVENIGLFVAAGVVELLPREKPPVGAAAAPPKGLPVAATPGVVGLLD